MPSTNYIKNKIMVILVALNIVHSKDNEIGWKNSQD